MDLFKCKCIKSDEIRGLVEGREYYVDGESFYKDCDGDIYAEIYTLFPKVKKVCISLYNDHFAPKHYTNSQLI